MGSGRRQLALIKPHCCYTQSPLGVRRKRMPTILIKCHNLHAYLMLYTIVTRDLHRLLRQNAIVRNSHQSTQLLANTQSTLVLRQKNQKQTKNFLNWVQTYKRTKRTLFIRTKHNQQISGVIAFIKLQIDT